MEKYAIILDYLPHGYIEEGRPFFRKRPVAQAIGKDEFTLLELIPKPGVELDIHEEVYIGPGKRDKIARVNRRLTARELTATARVELPYVVEEIVRSRENEFVEFFNKATSISTRLHQLELLPGIGKKYMWEIIKAREKEPFKSFEDIKKRVPSLSDPVKILVKRILLELNLDGGSKEKGKRGKRKYILFVKGLKRRSRRRR